MVEAVFTRLALGTYAAYLGLDEGVVLRAFDEEYGTTSSSTQPVYSERVDEREGTVSPSLDGGVLRVIGIVGAALAVLLLMISALDDDEDAQGLPATTSVPETRRLLLSVPLRPRLRRSSGLCAQTGKRCVNPEPIGARYIPQTVPLG